MERRNLDKKTKLDYSNKYTDADHEYRFVVMPLTFLKTPSESEL